MIAIGGAHLQRSAQRIRVLFAASARRVAIPLTPPLIVTYSILAGVAVCDRAERDRCVLLRLLDLRPGQSRASRTSNLHEPSHRQSTAFYLAQACQHQPHHSAFVRLNVRARPVLKLRGCLRGFTFTFRRANQRQATCAVWSAHLRPVDNSCLALII